MFRKLTVLVLALAFITPLSGCRSLAKREARAEKVARLAKAKGWEFVRIEKRVPHKDCVYKLQLACGEKDASKCYNYYKKEAKFYDCNTVVITEDIRAMGGKNDFMTGWKTGQDISALADLYDCPKYQVESETSRPSKL